MEGLEPDTDFKIYPNGQIGIKKLIQNADGESEFRLVTHTWHHHQDGKSIFPVPTYIHNVSAQGHGGFPHTGGAHIIDKGLQGLFKSPF